MCIRDSIRLGQNLQRGDLGNVFAPDFSVPGMRRMEHIVESPEQLIRGIIDGVAENTGKLARKPVLRDAVMTVSYTHLDVYKRQISRRWMLAGLPAKLFSSEERILLRMPSLVRFGVEKRTR